MLETFVTTHTCGEYVFICVCVYVSVPSPCPHPINHSLAYSLAHTLKYLSEPIPRLLSFLLL